MIDKQEIISIIEERLNGGDLFLVEVTVTPDNRIVVDVDSDDFVSIDDCAALSREIETHFDREVEDFELEVGSCGVTAPFKVLRQYRKNMGNEVEVLLKKGLKIEGILDSVSESAITLSVEKTIKPEGAKRKMKVTEQETYLFEEIKNAKYLIRFK